MWATDKIKKNYPGINKTAGTPDEKNNASEKESTQVSSENIEETASLSTGESSSERENSIEKSDYIASGPGQKSQTEEVLNEHDKDYASVSEDAVPESSNNSEKETPVSSGDILPAQNCPSCGRVLKSDERFCPMCGIPVRKDAVTSTEPAESGADDNNKSLGDTAGNDDRRPRHKWEFGNIFGKKGDEESLFSPEEQALARALHSQMRIQLVIVFLLIISVTAFIILIFLSVGAIYNAVAQGLSSLVFKPLYSLVDGLRGLNYTSTDTFSEGLQAVWTVIYGDLLTYYDRVIKNIIVWYKITAASPLLIYGVFSAWAMSISARAGKLFQASTLRSYKKIFNRMSFASCFGLLGVISGLASVFCYLGWELNVLLALVSFNLVLFSGGWLVLRFFSAKGGLKKVSCGRMPAKPWRIHVWAGNFCTLLFLCCVDAVAFLLFYFI